MKCIKTFSLLDGVLGESRYWHLAAATVFIGGAYYLHRRWRRRTKLSSCHAVVITGCDSGLGYNLALYCWHHGGTVIASVLREDSLGSKDLASRGMVVLPLDLTKDDSLETFATTVEEILRKEELELRALVNNSGVMIFGEFEWQLPEQVRQQLDVNLLGTMSITRRLMPMLRKYQSRLVNVTSHCAFEPLPGLSVYGASKAALQAWSTSLRVEVAKYGISVVMFVPGSFTRESNLMTRQREHFDLMRIGMSDEAKSFYGDYFVEYAEYLSGLSKNWELRRIENSALYEAFNGALLDDCPSAIYKCQPWRYTLYHALFRIAPTHTLRDRLVERFVQMPVWRQ